MSQVEEVGMSSENNGSLGMTTKELCWDPDRAGTSPGAKWSFSLECTFTYMPHVTHSADSRQIPRYTQIGHRIQHTQLTQHTYLIQHIQHTHTANTIQHTQQTHTYTRHTLHTHGPTHAHTSMLIPYRCNWHVGKGELSMA